MTIEVVTEAQKAKAEEGTVEEVSTPVAETAVEETLSSEEKEWDDLLLDEEDTPEELKGEEKVSEEEKTAVEEEPVEEEVPAEEVPEAAEIPEEEATPPEEEATNEVEVPEPVAPEPDSRTEEEVSAEIQKAREAARDDLVEQFAFTEEQIERFDENPSEVLSEMAADLYLDLFDSISQGLRSQMPGMVNGIIAQQKAQVAYDQQFYGSWPDLAKTEYRSTVDRIAKTYWQENPGMEMDKAIQEIGAQAWVALRLPVEQLLEASKRQEVSAPRAPVTQQAHVPASAGNTTQAARAPAPKPSNEFEQLADEFMIEDL